MTGVAAGDGGASKAQPTSAPSRCSISKSAKIRIISIQELLATSGASYADDYRSHIRLGNQLERQERATLPFCHYHFRYNLNPLAIAGNAESIPIREFLNLDHSRPKERCP